MPLYFDVIGIPGSGKSTLVTKCLSDARLRRHGIVSSREAARQPRGRLAQLLLSQPNVTMRLRSGGRIARMLTTKPNLAQRPLLSFADDYPDYFELCVELLRASSRPDFQFMHAFTLLESSMVDHVVRLAARRQRVTALVDEGLTQRALTILDVEHASQSDITRYFEHVPRPQCLVLMSTPIGACEQRIATRSRTIVRHHGFTEQQVSADLHHCQRVLTEGTAILESHGVPVLRLDGTKPADELVARVLHQIEHGTLSTGTGSQNRRDV